MTGRRTRLVLTVDVGRDPAAPADAATPPTFRAAREAVPTLLAPLCQQEGLRFTCFVDADVLCDADALAALAALPGAELAALLRADRPTAGDEADALAVLTELFVQRLGQRPRSFRAARSGAGRETGRRLAELGYHSDSSVAPEGPPGPYRVHRSGDLWRRATSPTDAGPLLEVPAAIRLAATAPGRDELLAVLDAAARDEDRGRPWQAVCVALDAAALTSEQRGRRLDDLRAVAARAAALGFAPRTVDELEREFTRREDAAAKAPGAALVQRVHAEQWTGSGPRPAGWRVRYERPDGAPVDTGDVLARHAVPPAHADAIRARAERWDVALAYDWLARSLSPHDAVLDVGCGVGANLQWLQQQGFDDLSGCDVDPAAIAAARELADATGAGHALWVDDGRALAATPARRYEAVAALDWSHRVAGFDLTAFLRRARALLSETGLLVFDYVDRDCDAAVGNVRAPSGSPTRFGAAELRHELLRCGFELVLEIRSEAPIQKGVVCCRRADVAHASTAATERPKVLYVVDTAGWAHDRKAQNLARCLGDEFDGRIVYQHALTEADLDAADLIVLFYWRQLESLPGLGAALARNRQKLLMGVCSHNELEGRLRAPGLSLLRRLPAHVFTHSALLEAEVRPLLPGTTPWCLPNGVDATFFTPRTTPRRTGPLRVGWAGSLDNFGADMRGVSTVIEPALALLGEQHPGRFELVLAAREQRWRSAEEMRAFYRELDVYVCASRVEGTPNPALEAAACGVPVVSTRVGNMPELLEHGRRGLLVERTPTALAAALLLLAERPDLRRQMGLALRAEIERAWAWEHRARGYAELFRATLRGAAAAPHRELAASIPEGV